MLTISWHPHRQTFLEAAMLAAVAIHTHDHAVFILHTHLVVDVLLDAPAEKTLRAPGKKSEERGGEPTNLTRVKWVYWFSSFLLCLVSALEYPSCLFSECWLKVSKKTKAGLSSLGFQGVNWTTGKWIGSSLLGRKYMAETFLVWSAELLEDWRILDSATALPMEILIPVVAVNQELLVL